MASEDDRYQYRAAEIPCDPELLEPLGLVMWAAIRLHHGIRDTLGKLTGDPSDHWFDVTLGAANARLARLIRTSPQRPHLEALLGWSENVAGPAIEARNGVAHAVAFTAVDGAQALRGNTPQHPERPDRYTGGALRAIAGQLVNASATMPNVTPIDAGSVSHWSHSDLLDDVSVGDWVRESIPAFGGTVSALVPSVFSTCVRVLHPAWSAGGAGDGDCPVRWAHIAGTLGAVMHQSVAWGSMIEAGVRSGRGTGRGEVWDVAPTAGDLPTRVIEALAAVLGDHTTTPDDCFFGFWDGTGVTGVPADQPRLKLPSRAHVLLRGTLRDAGRELQGFSPNVWWPVDHAWFVATDVDLMSTFIGGSTDLANALCAEMDTFEAIGSWGGAKITWDCDTINPRPPDPYTYG